MKLSLEAISDLKITLKNTFGDNFLIALSDEEVSEIGLLLLTALSEGLKLKVTNSKLQS